MTEKTASAVLPLDHVGLSVSDLALAAAFYGRLFAFDEVEETFALPQHGLRGMVLRNPGGFRLELFEKIGARRVRASDPVAAAEGLGWFQIAFRVADLAQAYEKAIAAGGQAVRPPFIAPDGKTPVAFIADPDGNLIELIERAG
jgi:catechol 2,3-dioxygenase-like lactoylglutathione lyase family enzyme